MKQFVRAFVLIIACCAMVSCTKSNEESDKPGAGIVAQIGSVSVTTQDLTQALKSMPAPQQFEYLADEGRKVLIDLIIDWKLLAQEALKAGLDRDMDVKAMVHEGGDTAYERNIVLGSAYLRSRMEELSPVSDEQIQEYYESHSADFKLAERRKVNRILFVTEERAREALPQLQQGIDFALYKERHSDEKIKVDTVWLQTTDNPNEFESAVCTLNIGEMSDVITMQSGSCVVRILEMFPAKTLPLAEVQERLRAQLQDSNERELIADIRQTLRQGLSVDINTDLLESYECGECDGRSVDLPGNSPASE